MWKPIKSTACLWKKLYIQRSVCLIIVCHNTILKLGGGWSLVNNPHVHFDVWRKNHYNDCIFPSAIVIYCHHNIYQVLSRGTRCLYILLLKLCKHTIYGLKCVVDITTKIHIGSTGCIIFGLCFLKCKDLLIFNITTTS